MIKNMMFSGVLTRLFTTLACFSILVSCDVQQNSPQIDQSDLANEESNHIEQVSAVLEEPEQQSFNIESTADLTQETSVISSRDTFYGIMDTYGMKPQHIYQIAHKVKEHFNMSSLARNRVYHVFTQNDSLQTPAYFVYEEDQRSYVTVSLTDSIYATRGLKPVTYKKAELKGTISSSLYETIHSIDGENELIYRLADLFAWQVDFYRIQKGDAFKVVYQQEFVDDEPTGNVYINSALFKHRGQDYYAFKIEDDESGREIYLDEDGRSLQKTFLRAPVRYERISSRYTKRRFHPVLKHYRAHLGTDYVARTGTPIYATADGLIKEAGYTSGNGNYVRIRHNSVYETGYLHMTRFGTNIKSGVKVKQGQVIGYVGQTGLATGPHVCYRFWKNSRQVDPFKQDNPPAEEFSEEKRTRLKKLLEQRLIQLNQVGEKKQNDDTSIAMLMD
jgi:murein DD-endopeptidase MepM/ murein hydrolase activator NlpD